MVDTLTENSKTLIMALAAQGVREYVVSPGSRNTPLALLLAESGLKLTMAVDERSAAFLALGRAKDDQRPVGLLATSGTATANYLPALAEAQATHLPLVVLTTDRPEELQGIGAPQTIGQTNLYGQQTKLALTLHLQDPHPDVQEYIAYKTQQVVQLAVSQPAGPVQLNLPLRKPLLPSLDQPWPKVMAADFGQVERRLASDELERLRRAWQGRKIMILVGPNEGHWSPDLFEQVAEQLDAPIVADILSRLRGLPHAITGLDAILAAQADQPEMVPDVVLRFGGTPVSAKILPWLKAHQVEVYQIGANYLGQDHSRFARHHYAIDEESFLADILASEYQATNRYYQSVWQPLHAAWPSLNQSTTHELTDFAVVDSLTHLKQPQQLFLANSMPVRDFEQYFQPHQVLSVAGNRGANGIDGTISTAVGMAMNEQPTWLAIGDLAFYHDMNGLMLARQTAVDLTIVVTNNNGGGIFSFLPQAAADQYFENLFGTPQNLAIDQVAQLYQAEYHLIEKPQDLVALTQQPWTGLRILELVTDRTSNTEVHANRLAKVKELVKHVAKH